MQVIYILNDSKQHLQVYLMIDIVQLEINQYHNNELEIHNLMIEIQDNI